jgi:hypothetical protein
VTPRYSVHVERRGTADYCAMVFRGARMVTDAHAHLPFFAVRDAVEHIRYLRREGALETQPRVFGGRV